MPNRLLKEGIVDSSALDALSPEEEVFFYRLLVVSDDFGRMDARLPILKSKCFPLKDLPKMLEKIEGWLQSLVRQKLIIRYQIEDKPYLQISKWEQRIRSKGKYPSADGAQLIDNSQTNDSNMQSNVGLGLGLGKGKGMGMGVQSPNGFEQFWIAYDKKTGKQNAIKEWKKVNPDDALIKKIVERAGLVAKTVDVQFRKDPERWIKGHHWDDEIVVKTQDKPTQRWDATLEGIMAKGKELGILPKPGETEGQYRERVRQG
jgi:hypothetical protein